MDRTAERRRRAVAAIKELSGEVGYDDNAGKSESFSVAFLRWRLPQAYLDKVAWVDLGKTQVTDAGLVHLEGLVALQWLHLDNTHVTDDGTENSLNSTILKSRMMDWLICRG